MNDIRDAHYALGKAYLNDSQYAEAILHFQAVLNLDVDFIDAYHALALAYFGQHELQEAKNAAQDALRIDPTYEPALAFLQAIVPQDTNRDAVKPVRAETTEPDTAPVTQEDLPLPVVDIDTDKEMERGMVFLNNKQYPQAEAAFKKVLKANSQDALAHYNLAQTYLETGATHNAQSEVDIALRLSPHYQPAHQLQNAITFLNKRDKQKQIQKKIRRYLFPLAIVAVIGLIGFNMGWFTSLLPEKIPPDLSIDAILEDPTNKNGYIDAGENVRLKLTLTNSGSTVKNVKVRILPNTIGGLRYEPPDKTLTIRKNGFETIRIPMTADKQSRTKIVPISIQALDKHQTILTTTEFHLNIKSK